MAPAPKQPTTDSFTPADVLAALDALPGSPDGSPQKITLTIGGSKVVIEGDSRDEEVKAAARLLKLAPSAPAPAAPRGRPKKDSTISLSKMIALYFDEVKATGAQQPKTIEENQSIFQLLLEVTKNPAAETIGIKTATDFKAILLRLRPNRGKGKFAGKSVSEVLRMRPSDTMASESVNKYLRRVSALFDWGKRHGQPRQ